MTNMFSQEDIEGPEHPRSTRNTKLAHVGKKQNWIYLEVKSLLWKAELQKNQQAKYITLSEFLNYSFSIVILS